MKKKPESSAPEASRLAASIERWRFSEFVLLGGVLALGLLILAIHLATWGVETRREARLLRAVECEIEGRSLRSRVDERGVVYYRPEVKIRYELNGETFVTSTFDRTTLTDDRGFSYAREEAIAALEPFVVGTKTRCWARVDDPKHAVLVRRPAIWGWIFLVIPVSLILFGGGWIVARIRDRAFSKEARADVRRRRTQYPTIPDVPPLEQQRGVRLARRLTPDGAKSFYFGAAALGAAVWNLASWTVFLYVATTSESRLELFLALGFGAIFCGVGALFACRLWGAFNVERAVGATELEISAQPIVPGKKFDLCLFLKGRIEAKRLDVFIRCEEVARYLQGTNSICNRREVFARTLFTEFDVDVPARAEETCEFSTTLPPGVAPSFKAEHNELAWKIVVQTEFADGGTFRREFGVVVYPLADPERGR